MHILSIINTEVTTHKKKILQIRERDIRKLKLE